MAEKPRTARSPRRSIRTWGGRRRRALAAKVTSRPAPADVARSLRRLLQQPAGASLRKQGSAADREAARLIRKAIAADPDAMEELLNLAEGPIEPTRESASAAAIRKALDGDWDAWNRLPPLVREALVLMMRLELVRRQLMGGSS